MQADARIHSGVLQQAVLDHILGAGEQFLGGLEHELDTAGQFPGVFREQPGGGKQHGGVGIVPAGVAVTILRRKGQSRFLGHGQGVHIAPEQEALALFGVADDTGDAGLSTADRGEAVFPEFFLHKGSGLRQVKAGFGIAVEGAAVFDEFLPEFFGTVQDHSGVHNQIFLSNM